MKPTLLLVHGAWHGAWCWEENVAPAMRAKGYEVVSVTLPGHDSPGSNARMWSGVGAYVEHVKDELNRLDQPAENVVLVGHSMGGLVVQRVMETEQVAAGVLVASMPRRGALGVLSRLFRADPTTVLTTISTLSLWPFVRTPERSHQLFFADDEDPGVVSHAHQHLQNESFPAFLSMLSRWPRPAKVTSPVSVIAAEQDHIFTLAEERDLARAYGTDAVVIEGAGHDLMLDRRWPQLVDQIDRIAQPEDV